MIQIRPGDLVAVEAAGAFYYALIVDRIRLFGGAWTFVFDFSSSDLLASSEVLNRGPQGWNAFVDFIWAKRENRLTRLARRVDTTNFRGAGLFKSSNANPRKASRWWIQNVRTGEVIEKRELAIEEQAYPMDERIDDIVMTNRVHNHWTPRHEYARQMDL